MKSKFTVMMILGFLTISLTAQTTKKIADKGDYLTLEIPSHWIFSVDKNMVISVLICSDTIPNGDRIDVYCSKAFGSLKDNYKTSQKALRNAKLKNLLIKEEGDAMLDGAEMKWYIFTYSDEKETITLTGKMFLIKKSGRLVTLKYILPGDKLDSRKETLEKIISTLHIN